MSAKDKTSKVFSYFKKIEGEFCARSHSRDSPRTGCARRTTPIYMWREQAIIEWTRRVNSIVACCHSVKLYALAARVFRSQQWLARAALLAGIAKTAPSKPCNQCKTLGQLGCSVFKCSDTNIDFETAIFLILFVRNNKRSSGINGKTSDCPSRICLYHRYFELRFCCNCSLNHLNM